MKFIRAWMRERAWRREADAQILQLVESSGLFSPEWYRSRYPDIRTYPSGPLAHFIEHGIAEQRDPGPSFSTASYLRRRTGGETKAGGAEPPFLEAVRKGPTSEYLWAPATPEALSGLVRESGLFDADWYLKTYHDLARHNIDPFEHFMRHGLGELRSPGPNFESDTYAEDFPEYREFFDTPLEHYLRFGKERGYPPRGTPAYEKWISRHDALSKEDRETICRDVAADPLPPIRVIAIVERTDRERIGSMVESLRSQVGTTLRLTVIADRVAETELWRDADGSPVAHVETFEAASRGIGDDEVVIVMAQAVCLAPHSAYVLARTLQHERAVAAYSDHDRIVEGIRQDPFFKPEMSPEYLRNFPYVGPVLALRAAEAKMVLGAVREGSTGDDTITSMLSLLPASDVKRSPFILYHVPGPADGDHEVPARRASEDPDDAALPSVSIVIPTRDRGELLRACIDSILASTDYPDELVEIVVIDNDSTDEDTLNLFDEMRLRSNTKVIKSRGAFNFSRINNEGVDHATGDIVVLLNNDTKVRERDWLRTLVRYARQPDIGVVGAMLLYPDETIQHGGVILGYEGVGGHLNVGKRVSELAPSDVTREMTCVTGACLALRRELYLQLGGLDIALEVAFNDVALCVASYQAGFRNIYVAKPLMYHYESKSRGFDTTREKIQRNFREGSYAVRRMGGLFRNDPSYSPNLALRGQIGSLANPPRVVRPWRRSGSGKKRVLLLSSIHSKGFGVPTVLALQADAMLARGFEVIVGGPRRRDDFPYAGCRRVEFNSLREAANFTVTEAVDAIVVHTPPYFGIARMLGRRPACYFFDHGEPPATLFADWAAREAVNNEKRRAAPFARRVLTISKAIRGQQHLPEAVVLRNGNSHLAIWDDTWARRRAVVRARLGLEGRFVVLNVGRFLAEERVYKGVDHYIEIAHEFGILFPHMKDRCVFALAGRAENTDIRLVEAEGIRAFANITDERMRELYAAADCYMSFSRWEGYNLGIGQALAMGLPVIASDIEAHREFPIISTNSTLEACEFLAQEVEKADPRAPRVPFLETWDTPLNKLCDIIASDLEADDTPWL